MSEREDDLKRYKAHVQAVNRATDKDIEKVATSPFRALSYLKTEDDLRQLLADERAAAFRAGQESMKARAVEVANSMVANATDWDSSAWDQCAEQTAVRIASLEPVNE